MHVNVYSINFCKSLLGYSIGRTPDMPCICQFVIHHCLVEVGIILITTTQSTNLANQASFLLVERASRASCRYMATHFIIDNKINKVEQGFGWVKHWRITFD